MAPFFRGSNAGQNGKNAGKKAKNSWEEEQVKMVKMRIPRSASDFYKTSPRVDFTLRCKRDALRPQKAHGSILQG